MAVAAHRTTTELCEVLLANFYGPTVSEVARVMLLYGRLEAVSISRRAELTPKLTRQSLAVLLQHGYVQYTQSSETGTERTYYECDWREVLKLLYTGKVVWWASKEISPEAAALVKYVSIYGRSKACDITSAFSSSADGASSGRADSFDTTLLDLVSKRILRVVPKHETTPREDFMQSMRLEELQSLQRVNIPETRKLKEAEERVRARLQQLQELADSPDVGLKRKADAKDAGRARKRLRMDDEPTRTVDPEVILRINHDKFHVHQRNVQLVQLCQARLGPTPAEVYRHILKELEPRIFRCRQDTSSIVITTLTISRALPKSLDLSRIWAEPITGNGNGKRSREVKRRGARPRGGRRRSEASEDDEDDDMDDDDEGEDEEDSEDEAFVVDDEADRPGNEDYDPSGPHTNGDGMPNAERVKMVNRFCDLLAADSLCFLRKLGSRSMGEWHVDFDALSNSLRQLEIESIMQQKFGDLAPRLLRIVKDKVKIDEKQLSTIALLKQKDIRHVLTSMHEAGALDLQEVPKRLDRQPNMTFFLWYHNRDRAVSCLAQDLCKAMSRVHQRLRHELGNRKRLLDKSQRTDVRNKESEYLSRDELSELRKIRLVEEKLLAQSARLASSYAILVDY